MLIVILRVRLSFIHIIVGLINNFIYNFKLRCLIPIVFSHPSCTVGRLQNLKLILIALVWGLSIIFINLQVFSFENIEIESWLYLPYHSTFFFNF